MAKVKKFYNNCGDENKENRAVCLKQVYPREYAGPFYLGTWDFVVS